MLGKNLGSNSCYSRVLIAHLFVFALVLPHGDGRRGDVPEKGASAQNRRNNEHFSFALNSVVNFSFTKNFCRVVGNVELSHWAELWTDLRLAGRSGWFYRTVSDVTVRIPRGFKMFLGNPPVVFFFVSLPFFFSFDFLRCHRGCLVFF